MTFLSSAAPLLSGRHRVRLAVLLGATLPIFACQVPPPEFYVSDSFRSRRAREVSLGVNSAGEACSQAASPDQVAAEIYCGTWEQPSARVRAGGAANAAMLADLVAGGPWRAGLEQRYACGPARSATILGSNPAMLMDCTRRNGGWPHVAFVALLGGRAWLADGVLPAAPAIERSIGILSGQAAATSTLTAGGDSLLAQRLAARAFSSGDVGQFQALIVAGNRANLEGNPAAAEKAYRSALELQDKKLGRNNPDQASPLIHVALQVSNQGKFGEARTLFAQAEKLAPRASDELVRPRLLHYEALDALNQNQAEQALGLLRQADALYALILSDSGVDVTAVGTGSLRSMPSSRERSVGADQSGPLAQSGGLAELQFVPTQNAVVGLVEVRRYRAEALRMLGRSTESEAAFRSADNLARWAGVDRNVLVARLAQTGALSEGSIGDMSAAMAQHERSSRAMDEAFPGTGFNGRSRFQQGADALRLGRTGQALSYCRSGLRTLTALRQGVLPRQAVACMDAFFAEASSDPARRQTELAEMFLIGQLSQSSFTTRQIQIASARLQENRNPAVAEAIYRHQQAALALTRTSDAMNLQQASGLRVSPSASPTPSSVGDLAQQFAAARTAEYDAEEGLQALYPLYNSVVQKPVTLEEVQRSLRPGEGLVAITLSVDKGWSVLVLKDRVLASPIQGGAATVDPLVKRIRDGMVQRSPMPAFDAAAASELYQVVLGSLDLQLRDLAALVVAPSGSLLSLPFGMLLTGAANIEEQGKSPWLIRRSTVTHVPAAVNFVNLRNIAGRSAATHPWFGFGDFRRVTQAQANAAFPGACSPSANLLAGLAPLRFARKELDEARTIFGVPEADTLLGPRFTPGAVRGVALKDYRILHFATHALLQSELQSDINCQQDAVIVTSAPPGASSGAQALLTASSIAQLQLDADVVVLSACNTGGADSAKGGESLASFARSFFGAGARSLLVANWEANDAAAYYVVTNTLRRLKAQPGAGIAGAQRTTVVSILDEAGRTLPADFAHPFFWAPFTVIGDDGATSGRGGAVASVAPARSGAGSGGI